MHYPASSVHLFVPLSFPSFLPPFLLFSLSDLPVIQVIIFFNSLSSLSLKMMARTQTLIQEESFAIPCFISTLSELNLPSILFTPTNPHLFSLSSITALSEIHVILLILPGSPQHGDSVHHLAYCFHSLPSATFPQILVLVLSVNPSASRPVQRSIGWYRINYKIKVSLEAFHFIVDVSKIDHCKYTYYCYLSL